MVHKSTKGLSATKRDLSEWYSDIVQKAELADLRYKVKGFVVFQPWSVMTMEHMYRFLEKSLERTGHLPYFFPTVIPESNLKLEASHLKGFTPEVFWVTHGGKDKLEEPLALRPTSETAFYQMFSLWVRSYRDLPFKTYQRANVFRHETKATRPFLRSREFHWIETHCLFPSQSAAEAQVKEDMETTEEILHEKFCLPFIFFERPQWDTFPGAVKTFAADALLPDGKFLQLPSTHLISQHFLSAFGVTFKDKDGKDKTPFATCYGPAVSRIMGAVTMVHGDDHGLRLPWTIAPYQVVFVPLGDAAAKKAAALAKSLDVRSYIDMSDKSPGEKFNHWELKGIPVRIDIGDKELDKKSVLVFRRDTNTKELVSEKQLARYLADVATESVASLKKQADSVFDDRIVSCKTMDALTAVVEKGGVGKCMFCTLEKSGESCADKVKEHTGALVRGARLEREKFSGSCIACGKKAGVVVYVGRAY